MKQLRPVWDLTWLFVWKTTFNASDCVTFTVTNIYNLRYCKILVAYWTYCCVTKLHYTLSTLYLMWNPRLRLCRWMHGQTLPRHSIRSVVKIDGKSHPSVDNAFQRLVSGNVSLLEIEPSEPGTRTLSYQLIIPSGHFCLQEWMIWKAHDAWKLLRSIGSHSACGKGVFLRLQAHGYRGV